MMKRILAIVLCFAMCLTGCSQTTIKDNENEQETSVTENTNNAVDVEELDIEFSGMNDDNLLTYVEDMVYMETVNNLNSEEFVVEEVRAVYLSKEYLEEVAYNSQSNLYFGYTIAELNDFFQDSRYVFTLSEEGTTTLQELQEIAETDSETILKNVAIGTGVILVCVTVSVVSAGVGAPAAVTAIFTASAKTATTFALSSSAFGAVSAGIVRGYQTGNLDEALDAAALAGSEGFKWGAISGAVIGGGKEAFLLKAGTKGGLTMNEVALIQKESNLPMDVIAQLGSMEEYAVYKEAGLKAMMVNGKTALVQDIDLEYVSKLADGTEVTNLERMQRGLKALDPATGKAYELHHIAQNNEGTLAVLTQEQHRGKGVFNKLHKIWDDSGVDHGADWNNTVTEFWKSLGNYYASGGKI